MSAQTKFFTCEKAEVNEEDRTIVAYITTETLDRDKEVVLATGADLDNYRKNPIVLWAHDSKATPVAKNLWIRSDGRGLLAKTQYAKTTKAEEIWQLRKGGFLKGYSIGFVPKSGKTADGLASYGPPHEKELKGKPEWKDARNIVRAWELVEYSDVPVPCNPEALERAYQGKSLIISPETAKELGFDSEAAIQKMIETLCGKDSDLQACVSKKIPKLIDEGYKQDQAVAIAYSMCRERKEFVPFTDFEKELKKARKQLKKQLRRQVLDELPQIIKDQLHVARGGV